MKNERILEMLNAGEIDELKKLLQEEIYNKSLSSDYRKRYAAMKKYFTYVNTSNEVCNKPCKVTVDYEEYYSFTNGYSAVITKEEIGEIKQFDDPGKYIKIDKLFQDESLDTTGELDINEVIAVAKKLGYKLNKSATTDVKYLLKYNDAYYSIALIDYTYSIINDGKVAKTRYAKCSKTTPLILENELGKCLISAINVKNEYIYTIIEK